jgi:hypothetical protein
MTFEQDGAMRAILKAVSDAVETGLTKDQIINEIQTGSDVRFSTLRPLGATDTPQRYGWAPIAKKKPK